MAELIGRVEAVLVNNPFPVRPGMSTEFETIQVLANRGVRGDKHFGSTRLLDVREKQLLSNGLPKGMEIANERQFSAISGEELKAVAEAMGIAGIAYGLLGENLVISGVEDFSQLPTYTLLFFSKSPNVARTAVLRVMTDNSPCKIPAENIAAANTEARILKPFQTAAINRRGVVGTVLSSGVIGKGDTVKIVTP